MTGKEIQERLFEKLERNLKEYTDELVQYPPETLLDRMEEIHATRMVYDQLRSGEYWSEHYEYLLRFKNPLELARDHWRSYQELDVREEMCEVFWDMMDKNNEEYYDLDPEYASSEQGHEMTLS